MEQLQLSLFDYRPPALALPVSDPRHPAYDRLNDGPLCAHELACLAGHGYALVEADGAGAAFVFDGATIGGSLDFWRSEIDVLYLLAKGGK